MLTSVNISGSTGFHRTGRAICVWRKHGFVSLSIPGHDPPIEITMYMDVATNPGPSSSLHQRNWQTDGTINHPPSFKIRGNSVCLSYLHTNDCTRLCYSRQDLLNIRRTISIPPHSNALGSLKLAGILRYRGKRAGKHRIPVIISNQLLKTRHLQRSYQWAPGRNINNLITIPTKNGKMQKQNTSHFVPTIMLANTMSLVPKLSEVEELILREKIQVCCITETWLKDHISDTVVNIEGYNITRNDRSSHEHGGVCVYVKEDVKYEIPEKLRCCNDHEIIWLKLDPSRSPRGFSCILLAVVYYPGRNSPAESDSQNLLNHLFDSLKSAESLYPNCGIIVTGDFNRLDICHLRNHFKLKQLVKFPTRGQATLDLILTNMGNHFSTPESFPPFGLSDHSTVIVKPKERILNQHTRKKINIRDMRESKKTSLGRYLSNVDWSCINMQSSCEGKLRNFNELITNGINNIMPERSIKVYPKDAPWMTIKLKELIRLRQNAFHSNKKGPVFRFYRNAVNRERKLCKAAYYTSKVQDLKGVNPRQWWKEINKLSGSKKQNPNLLSSLDVQQFTNMSPQEIASAINEALLEPLQSYQPINCENTSVLLPTGEGAEFPKISTHRVYINLKRLNKHKAPGPDGIPNWVLKEYAEILAQPITDILNTSYKEQKLPSVKEIGEYNTPPKGKTSD